MIAEAQAIESRPPVFIWTSHQERHATEWLKSRYADEGILDKLRAVNETSVELHPDLLHDIEQGHMDRPEAVRIVIHERRVELLREFIEDELLYREVDNDGVFFEVAENWVQGLDIGNIVHAIILDISTNY